MWPRVASPGMAALPDPTCLALCQRSHRGRASTPSITSSSSCRESDGGGRTGRDTSALLLRYCEINEGIRPLAEGKNPVPEDKSGCWARWYPLQQDPRPKRSRQDRWVEDSWARDQSERAVWGSPGWFHGASGGNRAKLCPWRVHSSGFRWVPTGNEAAGPFSA